MTKPVLFYFRDAERANFGDELNPWLWDRVLPGLLEGTANLTTAATHEGVPELFLGIGTILGSRTMPTAPTKLVFGSGFGYDPPPRVDSTWRVYCVRGPMTARALGLPPQVAATDPALLLAEQPWSAPPVRSKVGFMPHWGSVAGGAWRRACEAAGVTYVDPVEPSIERTVQLIRGCDLLLAEAMHGAIVADAFRVPWVPITTAPAINAFKWVDWCASLDLVYEPRRLPDLEFSSKGPWPWEARTFARVEREVGRLLHDLAGAASPSLSADAVWSSRRAQLVELLARVRSDLEHGQRPPPCVDRPPLPRTASRIRLPGARRKHLLRQVGRALGG